MTNENILYQCCEYCRLNVNEEISYSHIYYDYTPSDVRLLVIFHYDNLYFMRKCCFLYMNIILKNDIYDFNKFFGLYSSSNYNIFYNNSIINITRFNNIANIIINNNLLYYSIVCLTKENFNINKFLFHNSENNIINENILNNRTSSNDNILSNAFDNLTLNR